MKLGVRNFPIISQNTFVRWITSIKK